MNSAEVAAGRAFGPLGPTMRNAQFKSAPDDLMVRPPVNLNMPIKPTANHNSMSVAHTLTEASDAHGMQNLAQKMSVGSKPTAAADIDYRQIWMASRDSTRIGSSKNATQTALDSIAGKSAGGSLTLDGSGRTLHESGKLTLSGSKDSGKLHVFRQNDEGRVLLSVGEKVSAEDLLRRPMGLKETTARTIEKWEQVKAGRNPVWDKGPTERGVAIERDVGQNLPQNFPTLDRMVKKTGDATSIKSRDLDAKTYLDPKKLQYQLKRDINKLADFTRGQIGEIEVKLADIKQKILDVRVPHEGHSMQKAVFDAMQEYAASKDIILNISVY